MSELLPCPFCGGEAEWKTGGPGCAWVSCTKCPAETGDGSIPRITAAWNTRAPTPVAAAMAVPEVMDMPATDVGDVGNYYGGLAIMAKDGVAYWSIENWDGHHWMPCPLPVFAALAAMKGGAA